MDEVDMMLTSEALHCNGSRSHRTASHLSWVVPGRAAGLNSKQSESVVYKKMLDTAIK